MYLSERKMKIVFVTKLLKNLMYSRSFHKNLTLAAGIKNRKTVSLMLILYVTCYFFITLNALLVSPFYTESEFISWIAT